MTLNEARDILNKEYPDFCYGIEKYNPVTCDIMILYEFIMSVTNYIYAGDHPCILRDYKLIFNARLTFGEGPKPFEDVCPD